MHRALDSEIRTFLKLTTLSRSSSIEDNSLPNCFNEPAIINSSSVDPPIQSNEKLLNELAKFLCALDKAEKERKNVGLINCFSISFQSRW